MFSHCEPSRFENVDRRIFVTPTTALNIANSVYEEHLSSQPKRGQK